MNYLNNQKGFTLFTALISLILVSISLALVFNMIATEETYLDLIQDQASMSDLITMGDLAKADAFNSFLISLRSKWEESKSTASFDITRKQIDMNWDEFVDEFVKVDFFERGFPAYFAQSLLYNLEYKQNPSGYAITIKKDGIGRIADDNSFVENTNFNEIIDQIFKDGGQKVDVVDCDQDSDECLGSFYLTLDTTKISDENYEMLPIITVLRYKTNQVIQRPILNRQVYKIYMPWRGFQAFRVARRMALGEAEKDAAPAIAANYNGLFNPALHNTLEQARLGFCDPGTCSPRPGFFTTPSTKGFGTKCHLCPDQPILPNLAVLGITINDGSYKPLEYTNMNETFTTLYNAVLSSSNLPSINTYADSKLIMHGSTQIGDVNIQKVVVETEKKRTKRVLGNDPATIDIGTYSQNSFQTLTDISGITGGLGLFLNDDNKSELIWTKDRAWSDLYFNKSVGSDSTDGLSEFSCVELKSTRLELQFEEQDPRYFVRNTYGIENKPVLINIRLMDTYTPFFFPHSTSFWSNLTASNNYLTGSPPALNEDFEKDWTCYTWLNADSSDCGVH